MLSLFFASFQIQPTNNGIFLRNLLVLRDWDFLLYHQARKNGPILIIDVKKCKPSSKFHDRLLDWWNIYQLFSPPRNLLARILSWNSFGSTNSFSKWIFKYWNKVVVIGNSISYVIVNHYFYYYYYFTNSFWIYHITKEHTEKRCPALPHPCTTSKILLPHTWQIQPKGWCRSCLVLQVWLAHVGRASLLDNKEMYPKEELDQKRLSSEEESLDVSSSSAIIV